MLNESFQILILILILFIKYRTIECILHTNLINSENITLLWKISQDFESFVVAIIIGQLLQNICITDNHEYVTFVMDTIPSFYLIY
jgi:hypothetical protein